MKNKKNLLAILAIALVFGMTACKESGGGKDLKYSIEVNNQAAAHSAIKDTDKVELYINNFEYNYDTFRPGEDIGYGLIIVADGDRTYPGGVLDNAGWYSVTADLGIVNGGYELGSYSSFAVYISKLKVDDKVYDFPNDNDREVTFGKPNPIFADGNSDYPDNFSGINITASATGLKTVLIVEPEIIDDDGNLVSDPYKYIKVEGRLSE